ncbi:MAG: hypothetical protein KF838_02640 [Phycisphaeraceae bacterium]|nr:MAG: hypothetical protein KF838_02640 [Phycisphaeraceae bacterium]
MHRHADPHHPARRSEVARAASDALARADLRSTRALVGFDGFVDFILDLVDVRANMSPDGYRRIQSLDALAGRIGAASGKSTNIEGVVREKRWGGNGPLLAGGVARLGMRTTYIGAVATEDDRSPPTRHPIFAPLGALCEGVIPIAPPGRTDAMEFDDGKLMINHCTAVQGATWERIVEIVGLERLRKAVGSSALVGIVNWSLMGGVNGIWRGLIDHVLSEIPSRPRVFIDLSDPAKRTDGDLAAGLALLTEMNTLTPVTLGLNLAEAERLCIVCGVPAVGLCLSERIVAMAKGLRQALRLECVVIHPREGAGAATSDGDVAWFDGPMTRTPRISTGAGDHFNAGFAAARVAGLNLEQSLASGTAASGAYVRDGEAPTIGRLCEFLRDLPPPEAD